MARNKRDFQRSRVYRAEKRHSLYKRDIGVYQDNADGASYRATGFRDGSPIMTMGEVSEYIEKIMRSRWWKSRMPSDTYLNLKDGRGTRMARGGAHGAEIRINLPRWARHPIVILHELAHCTTPMNRRIAASHGRQFCSNYLALIKRWMGHEAWLEMKQQFKTHRVKYVRKAQ